MRTFDRMLRRFGANGTLAILVAMTVIALWLLSYTPIPYAIAYVFKTVFGFIWNNVLPWPDCGFPTGRKNDLDVCAGLGVIYLPVTFILTLGVLLGGVALLAWFAVTIIRNSR